MLIFAISGLIACEPDAPDKDQRRARELQQDRQLRQDLDLLQDEASATTEFERRLREQVHFRDGVLVIRDEELPDWISVVPASILWIINCGPTGLIVSFGPAPSVKDSGPVLNLTWATVPAEMCEQIAVAVGETLLAITHGEVTPASPRPESAASGTMHK